MVQVEAVVKVNLLGALFCTQYAMKLLSQQEGVTSHIFNTVGSGVKGGGTPGYVAYGSQRAEDGPLTGGAHRRRRSSSSELRSRCRDFEQKLRVGAEFRKPASGLPGSTKRGLPQMTDSLVKEIEEGVQGYEKVVTKGKVTQKRGRCS